MRLSSFLLCASQPMLSLFFSLALLVPIPGAHGPSHFPLAILPTLDNPEWEVALLQLQDSWMSPRAVAAAGLRPRGPLREFRPEDPRPGLLRALVAENSWRQEGMRRGQRVDLEKRPLGPFLGHPMDTLHYQEGGGNGNKAPTLPLGFRLSAERREALGSVLEGSKKGGGT